MVVKATLREGLTPVAIANFRFLIAGGLFLVVLLLNKIRKPNYVLLIERRDFPGLLFLALTGVTLFFTIQYTGIQMASASIASILVCLLAPILISVLSALIFKERLSKRQIVGIGTAALGTLTVIAGGTLDLETNRVFFVGTLILLSTPFLWAAHAVEGKKIMEKYNPFLVAGYVNILGGLCLVPFSVIEDSFHEISIINLAEWAAILYLALFCSLLGYFIWFHAISKVRAAAASSFMFAEPLITVLLARVF